MRSKAKVSGSATVPRSPRPPGRTQPDQGDPSAILAHAGRSAWPSPLIRDRRSGLLAAALRRSKLHVAVSTRTRATFHLPHSSQEPLELSVRTPALAMAVVHRDYVSALGEKWAEAVGVYVLLGPGDGHHGYRAYVGKSGTGGLRRRLTHQRHSQSWKKRHNLGRDWWQRALVVRSRDEDGFNSAQAGWLEGLLWDILDQAPAAQLVGQQGVDETLTKDERKELEPYVAPITAVLRALGASPDTLDQQRKPRRAKKHATVADLIRAELLAPGARLRSIPSQHEEVAHVRADGQLTVVGEVYDSPSGAAVAVVGHETNGWTFWGAPSGDGRLVPLAELRKRLDPSLPEGNRPPALPREPAPLPTRAAGALKPLVDAGILPSGSTVWGKYRGVRREAIVDAEASYIWLAVASTRALRARPSRSPAARRTAGDSGASTAATQASR